MQDKNKKQPKQAKQKNILSDYETFALAGGKKNPSSGTTIPNEEGVEAAKSFVEKNQK